MEKRFKRRVGHARKPLHLDAPEPGEEQELDQQPEDRVTELDFSDTTHLAIGLEELEPGVADIGHWDG